MLELGALIRDVPKSGVSSESSQAKFHPAYPFGPCPVVVVPLGGQPCDNPNQEGCAVTTKDELLHLVDELDEDAVGELLDYAQWLAEPEDILSDEEQARVEAGKAEIARGEYVTLEKLRRKLNL